NDSLAVHIGVNLPQSDTSNYSYKLSNLKPGTSLVEIFQVFENLREIKLISQTIRVEDELPLEFSVAQNYPNPFNPSTKIKFSIPSNVNRETSNVRLIVYDILGRQITTLVDEQLSSGVYEIEFNANELSSGVYFYKLTSGNFVETKKMMILR